LPLFNYQIMAVRLTLTEISLAISAILSGLYGGTGFFTIMGGNPAVAGLSDRSFAEFWQQVDSYMGARMPVFGPILMLSLLLSVIALIPERKTTSFWLMALALLVMILDLVFTLSTNHPLNRLIQSWDLNQLPANVQEIKAQVVHAFWFRSVFMILSFVCVVAAIYMRRR
jgi:hypothetical protein